jgi:carbon monoxide dehydrogenase subunit G
MLIEGRFPVAAPPQALMRHLFDARLMASCLPGCEMLEALDDDRYRAVVVVGLAGIQARFDLLAEVTRREELAIWAVTRGEEGGQASTLQAETQVTLEASPEGSLVNYRSEVSVTGRLGRFALGMMKKKAQSMGDEFALNLRERLQALEGAADAVGTAAATDAAPLPSPAPASMAAAAAEPVERAPASPTVITAVPATPPTSETPSPSAAPAVAPPLPRPGWWARLWARLFGRRP